MRVGGTGADTELVNSAGAEPDAAEVCARAGGVAGGAVIVCIVISSASGLGSSFSELELSDQSSSSFFEVKEVEEESFCDEEGEGAGEEESEVGVAAAAAAAALSELFLVSSRDLLLDFCGDRVRGLFGLVACEERGFDSDEE